jgi:hypothetical protein
MMLSLPCPWANEMFPRGGRDRNARHTLALGIPIGQAGPGRPAQAP